MNRLQLAQRLRSEAGALSASPLTTTLNLTGDSARLVDWVDAAWIEIQQMRKWNWLWEQATVTITAGTNLTAGSVPAHRYDRDSAFVGQTPLTYADWDVFRTEWTTTEIVDGTPQWWTIRPDNAFVVNAKPTADFAITVERWKNPIAMAADADEPAMPSEFHMLIVWKAVMFYAGWDEAGAMYQNAAANFRRIFKMAVNANTPGFSIGDALC